MFRAKEEIFAAERRDTGLPEDSVGEIFVRGQACRGGIVLRVPGAASGPQMHRLVSRRDTEQQAGPAVEIFKCKTEFGAGEGRINRLVRIEIRLALAKFP